MNIKLYKQYNNFSQDFSESHSDGNKHSNEAFFSFLKQKNLQNKKVLDLACGDGTDMVFYKTLTDDVQGVDASELLVDEARKKGLNTQLGYFEAIPFQDDVFDVVLSKYALQTVADFDRTYAEVARVLKPEGRFIFLTVHPMRQFFEKKTDHKDFFEKNIVKSVLFSGNVTVEEPTHTNQEYLSPIFFKYFELDGYTEAADFYSAEKIGDHEYPTYMIISAKKR